MLTKYLLDTRLEKEKAKVFFFDRDFVCIRGDSSGGGRPWFYLGTDKEIKKDEQLRRAGEARRAEAELSLVAWDAFFHPSYGPRSEADTELAWRKVFFINQYGIRTNGLVDSSTAVHQLSLIARHKGLGYMSAAGWPGKPLSNHGTPLEKAEDEQLKREGAARTTSANDSILAWIAYREWDRQVRREEEQLKRDEEARHAKSNRVQTSLKRLHRMLN
jgi:hypothetical protein